MARDAGEGAEDNTGEGYYRGYWGVILSYDARCQGLYVLPLLQFAGADARGLVRLALSNEEGRPRSGTKFTFYPDVRRDIHPYI